MFDGKAEGMQQFAVPSSQFAASVKMQVSGGEKVTVLSLPY